MKLTTVSNGVGGSYTKWQGEPPAHKVIMAKHETNEEDDTWTTVKAYNLLERPGNDNDVTIESGAMGPENTPFAHDVDFERLTDEQQAEIREYAIEEFRNEAETTEA